MIRENWVVNLGVYNERKLVRDAEILQHLADQSNLLANTQIQMAVALKLDELRGYRTYKNLQQPEETPK